MQQLPSLLFGALFAWRSSDTVDGNVPNCHSENHITDAERPRLRKFRDSERLAHDYREYNHWAVNNDRVPFSTILGWMQPIPAYIGLIFCILTVFFFATAGWWNHGEKHIDIWSTFVGVSFIFASNRKSAALEKRNFAYFYIARSSRDILAHPESLPIWEQF